MTLCCNPASRASCSATTGNVVSTVILEHFLPRDGGCNALSRLALSDSRAFNLLLSASFCPVSSVARISWWATLALPKVMPDTALLVAAALASMSASCPAISPMVEKVEG